MKNGRQHMNAEQRRAASRCSRQPCAFCGAPSATRDHIPPRGVFGDVLKHARGTQLITVPACLTCNWGSAEDDTYFREVAFLASQQDGEPPEFADVRATIQRAADKAGKKYRTPMQELFRNAVPVWGAVGPSGVLERGLQFAADWGRIKKVVERVARGLYWKHTGARVPPGYGVNVIGEKELSEFTTGQQETYTEITLAALENRKRHIHSAVFSYATTFARDDPKAACFAFVFYRRQQFLALIERPPSGVIVPAAPQIVLA
jgi:hypothetical protein